MIFIKDVLHQATVHFALSQSAESCWKPAANSCFCIKWSFILHLGSVIIITAYTCYYIAKRLITISISGKIFWIFIFG